MANGRDNFYVVLPSNSSVAYFPKNTTTRFVTRLSHTITLPGEWEVGLTEIQTPTTFLHITQDNEENYLGIMTYIMPSGTEDSISEEWQY